MKGCAVELKVSDLQMNAWISLARDNYCKSSASVIPNTPTVITSLESRSSLLELIF